jgi:hypothetical protein
MREVCIGITSSGWIFVQGKEVMHTKEFNAMHENLIKELHDNELGHFQCNKIEFARGEILLDEYEIGKYIFFKIYRNW